MAQFIDSKSVIWYNNSVKMIREEVPIMIHRHRGNRRYQTYLKAKRKERIVHELNDYWYYPHFGQYRKGKIHCSCPMCAAKTNTRMNKSRGPVSSSTSDVRHVRGSRLSVTNQRYGKKNYKCSELRHVVGMAQELEEYGYA